MADSKCCASWKYSGTGLVRSMLIGPLALGSRSGIVDIRRVIRLACLYILTTAELARNPDRCRLLLAGQAGSPARQVPIFVYSLFTRTYRLLTGHNHRGHHPV